MIFLFQCGSTLLVEWLNPGYSAAGDIFCAGYTMIVLSTEYNMV
jgi:hypothetical protein